MTTISLVNIGYFDVSGRSHEMQAVRAYPDYPLLQGVTAINDLDVPMLALLRYPPL
jgi:hypothetical protein